MSSVSSLSSVASLYQTNNQNNPAQLFQDLNAIGAALQSGGASSLTDAQSALAAFQQDLSGNSQSSSTQPFGKNTQANTDFQNLTSALNSGDTAAAQKAFASLQSDLKSAQKGHHHHHHGGGGVAPAADTSTATTDSTTASTAGSATVDGATGGSAADSGGNQDGSLLNVTA